jgi:hypothetical protein
VPLPRGSAQLTKGIIFLAFPEIEKGTGGNTVRIKRQLLEQAILHAAAGSWAEAAETNRRIIELGPDAEAENRLAKALWEQGELGQAREHYQVALALDPTNRIAERNIERLRALITEAGDKTVAAEKAEKAPVAIFVEETGKTGFAMLTDLAAPRALAHVNPGDAVELIAEGNRLYALANGQRGSGSSSRALPRDSSSCSPTVTSTRPASPRWATETYASSSARSSRTPATTARSASQRQLDRPTCARTPRARFSARRS